MPADALPSFRVPRDDRSILAIPDLASVPPLVDANRRLFESTTCTLHGRSLTDLRNATRDDALKLARAYTSSLHDTEISDAVPTSLIVGGHQPELFHVGVWAKNFALAGIAHQSQSMALNLVIDNDTLTSTALRVPTGTREQMKIEHLLFDTPRPAQPWEEAVVRDRETFQNYGSLVRNRVQKSWGFDPLVGSSWDAAVRQTERSERLCDALTALRASVERRWGLHNLELPMSHLCETEPFCWFTASLLLRLPQLNPLYNQTVAIYRRQHRLRNRRQPVPNLETSNDWLEAPFWIWKRGDNLRGRLFVRQTGSIFELRHENSLVASWPLSGNASIEQVVARLRELPDQGIRLRPRALTLTLFARVCLADLFVHGIGGAKYDWMTDRLCEQLFGMTAPRFATVSATLYLPLGPTFSTSEVQLKEINHKIRDLAYNPDRHIAGSRNGSPLIEEKHQLLAVAQALRDSHQMKGRLRADQHRRLSQIRDQLQSSVNEVRSEYEALRSTIRAHLVANSLIRNREYSFVLYPEDQVHDFLMPLAKQSTNPAQMATKIPFE